MDQIKATPALFIAVVLVAGVVFYLLNGSRSSETSSTTRPPSGAFEMTVSSVAADGSFRGKVEPAGRHAPAGLSAIGTSERVSLTLADLALLEPVRDPCWSEEGQAAVKELIGARIWVDPTRVERLRSGSFAVFAWNRDDVFVQEALLADGDAKVVTDRLDPRYATVLQDAEDAAARDELGRWGACG